MSELLDKYMNYIIENQLHNDAGILYVRGKLQGDKNSWYLAVWRYSQVMGNGDQGYLGFRGRWAWNSEKVDKVLASDDGKLLKQRVNSVATYFSQQTGLSGYILDHAPYDRGVDAQTSAWKSNWSVPLLANELKDELNHTMTSGHYPDPPTEASGQRFYDTLRGIRLAAVANPTSPGETFTSPTNAAPGTSDHGHLSAVDFIVYQHGRKVASTETSQKGIWRAVVRGGSAFQVD